MKKLFKLLSLLRMFRELRGHRRHGHHYHRSRSHYPLYQRHGFRRSIAEGLLSRVLGGRRY